MANKPGVLCILKKDKLIDVQPGFTDTFNWVVASMNNLKGGQNCDVSWPAPDTPQVDVAYAEGDGSSSGNNGGFFHFGLALNGNSATIGEGCVQIGGYTYFSNGGTVSVGSGTRYICVQCDLGSSQGVGITFVSYSSTSEINSAQGDLTKYVFPLYKIVDGALAVDYRPLPNAGCWEIAESISNGGSGGS